MRMLRAHLGAYAGSSPGAAGAGYFRLEDHADSEIGGSLDRPAVLHRRHERLWQRAKDQIDPALTDDVEALLEQSLLREFAGLEPTPIPATPLSHVGPAFVEIPLIIEDGHVPLDDLDALYGVDGAPVVVLPVPAHVAPPADLVDDTPAMIASVWDNPPLDIK